MTQPNSWPLAVCLLRGSEANVRRVTSFYSRALGKRISGYYTDEQGILTVDSVDGRTKKTELSESVRDPEYLARQILIELEREKPG